MKISTFDLEKLISNLIELSEDVADEIEIIADSNSIKVTCAEFSFTKTSPTPKKKTIKASSR